MSLEESTPAPPEPVNSQEEAASPAKSNSSWGIDLDQLIGRVLSGVFFLSILTLYPYADVYEFDPDEGNRMMIAKSVSEGNALYGEIWNDQPPLMTYVLRIWCAIFGWDVNPARVLTLILASVMAFAGYDAIRIAFASDGTLGSRVAGHVGGLVWMLTLPIVDQFLRLSVSAMVGLPSIAMAVVAIWAYVHWTVSRHQSWLIASAVFMGCSLMIKAFTGFLLPIIGLAVLITAYFGWQRSEPLLKLIKPPAIWSAVVIGFCLVLLLMIVPVSDFSQLYKPHTAGAKVDIGGSDDASLKRLESYVKAERHLFWLAAIGAVGCALRQKWSLLVFAAWCVAGYIGLRNHAPVWYHHGLLITVPAALLAGALIASVIHGLWPFRLKLATVGSGVVGIAGLIVFGMLISQFYNQQKFTFAEMRKSETAKHQFFTAVVQQVQKLNPDQDMLVTDRQMYAINAGLRMPPNLCLTTSKRVDTGNLSTEEFVAEITEHQPNQVVLVRAVLKALGRDIEKRILADYEPLLQMPNQAAFYVRRSLEVNDKLAILKAAAEEAPNAGFAWVLIGQQQLQARDMAGAVATFENALSAELDPRSFVQVASFYVQQRTYSQDPAVRDPAKAEQVVQRMIQIYQGNPPRTVLELAAGVAAAQNKFSEALDYARKALQGAQQVNDQAAIQRLNTAIQQLQAAQGN